MHRAHDYRHLLSRWRAVCRRAGLRLRRFGEAGEHPLHYIRTPALSAAPGVYLSTGIHGDEPAGPASLIAWAEAHARHLRGWPLLIFPCLNPWGLVNNSRFDAEGRDLNRVFQRDDLAFVAAWKRVVAAQQFRAALTLHEDFDGEGLYLYEVQHHPPGWGEKLLLAARPIIPIDSRARIDSYSATAGIIRRKLRRARFERIGYPEAVWLHLHHAERTFTIETPSEFALEQRAAAHRAVLEAALALALP